MLSPTLVQVLALVTYGWLAAALVLARPPIPSRPSEKEAPSADSGEVRSWETPWLVALAIVFLYPLAVLIAPSTILLSAVTVHFPGDGIVQLVGFALIFVGGTLLAWAFRSLGRYATVHLRLSPNHVVVQTGPYARIRHPLYTANILLGIGITLTFLSLLLWIPLVAVVLIARSRALTEERMFLSSPELRPAYQAYVSSTGRFIPACGR